MPRPEFSSSESSRRSTPRNYFSRREQYRLMVLVGLLFGVVWAMNEARKPKNWYWLTGQEPEAEVQAETEADPAEGYDTLLADEDRRETLSPGVFEFARETPPTLPELESEYFPGVRPDYVQAVADDWPINRGSEYHAFYHFLNLLERTPLTELEEASQGEVGFRQLFEQSEEYRGQLVTLNAIVHRVSEEQAPPGNEFGIDKYYRLWMEPVGGPREVMTAIFLELPENFPTTEEAVAAESPQIEFTGFFYKREPYESNAVVTTNDQRTSLRIAPLVLAKSLHWIPPPPAPTPPKFEAVPFAAAVFGVLVLAISLAGAAWYFSRRRSPQAEKYSLTGRVRAEDIAQPGDDEVLPSALDSLAQLAEADKQAAGKGLTFR